MNRSIALLFVLTLTFAAKGQEVIPHHFKRNEVATPLSIPQGANLESFVLPLGNYWQFHFDILNTDWKDLNYTAIHCDHNWKPSDLESTEYIQGFPNQLINTIENSFSTQVEYAHYQFQFPSDLMQAKLSGNYAIIVYEGNDWTDRSSWWLTYRVVLTEELVEIFPRVNASSYVSQRFTHHEIDFVVQHPNYSILNPINDFHISLLQNNCWNTSINFLKPRFVKNNELDFDYQSENNFQGGSEYRFFDIKNLAIQTSEVQSIIRNNKGYFVTLLPDLPMGAKAYQSERDINGLFLVKSDIASDSHLEAEYVYVQFFFQSPELKEGKVMVDIGQNSLDNEVYQLSYDSQLQGYRADILLKQGYYNYRYVLFDQYHPGGDLSYTEGNHFETENEYLIIAYNYERSLGYDRVVGFKRLYSRQ
ncbi:MAG: hypothetical protein RLZZ77_2167 [Bacteroidota bacterium]|jgi:hypothetical protein